VVEEAEEEEEGEVEEEEEDSRCFWNILSRNYVGGIFITDCLTCSLADDEPEKLRFYALKWELRSIATATWLYSL